MRFCEFNESHIGGAVYDLKTALLKNKRRIQSLRGDREAVYDIIDHIMQRISRSHDITGKKLLDMWVTKYKKIPDTWIMKR